MTLQKPNAQPSHAAFGAGLALLAAFGFSMKAIFVKNFHNYTKKPSQHHA